MIIFKKEYGFPLNVSVETKKYKKDNSVIFKSKICLIKDDNTKKVLTEFFHYNLKDRVYWVRGFFAGYTAQNIKDALHKRIILVGYVAAGKSFIRNKFKDKGFKISISYTTRPPREGELDKIDYNFISEEKFKEMIERNEFYEYAKHGEYYYGTGLKEWEECDIFIMEPDGIKQIKPEDKKYCVIIFVNTLFSKRVIRMMKRGWSDEEILKRINIDSKKFSDFNDFDFQIKSE